MKLLSSFFNGVGGAATCRYMQTTCDLSQSDNSDPPFRSAATRQRDGQRQVQQQSVRVPSKTCETICF